MKKLFAMAVALLTATSMFAQPEAGTFTLQPSAGVAIATLSGDGTKAKVGFQGRFEGAYQVSDAFAVSLGLGCSQYGAKKEGTDGDKLFKQLREKKIFVRHFKGERIKDYLRITIGTDAQMDAFLQALDEII